MGICMSSNSDDLEQKKRSEQIDGELKKDAARLRRECKILLLGKSLSLSSTPRFIVLTRSRIRRVGQVHYSEADEDYTSERIHSR